MTFLPSSPSAAKRRELLLTCFTLLLSHLRYTSTASPTYLNRVGVLVKDEYTYDTAQKTWNGPNPLLLVGILAFQIDLAAFTIAEGSLVPEVYFKAVFINEDQLDMTKTPFDEFYRAPYLTTLKKVALKKTAQGASPSPITPTALKTDPIAAFDQNTTEAVTALLNFAGLQVAVGKTKFKPQVSLVITKDQNPATTGKGFFVAENGEAEMAYKSFEKDGTQVAVGDRAAPEEVVGIDKLGNSDAFIVNVTEANKTAEQYAIILIENDTNNNKKLTDDEFYDGLDKIANFKVTPKPPVVVNPWYKVPWKLGAFIAGMVVVVILLLGMLWMMVRKKIINK